MNSHASSGNIVHHRVSLQQKQTVLMQTFCTIKVAPVLYLCQTASALNNKVTLGTVLQRSWRGELNRDREPDSQHEMVCLVQRARRGSCCSDGIWVTFVDSEIIFSFPARTVSPDSSFYKHQPCCAEQKRGVSQLVKPQRTHSQQYRRWMRSREMNTIDLLERLAVAVW